MSRVAGVGPSLLILLAGPTLAQVPSSPQTPLAAAPSPPAASASPTTLPPRIVADPRLSDENLLLFDVTLDGLPITDSLGTYAAPDGPLIPLGELSRLLDVDLAVSTPERRISDSIGEARRPILIDLATGLMRLDGAATKLAPGEVVVGVTDLYVRPALLERILPVAVTVDSAGLRLVLKAREPLPIQSRLDRLGRLRDLRPDIGGNAQVLRVAVPHRPISAPSFDVSLAAAAASRDPKFLSRYDIRAGADVLYTGFQGYLGSDDNGKPATARALFERRDPAGRLFGPLGVTRASVGDLFTPTLALGARSVGGRGFSLTTAPLEQASVFERIDLRGELPIGYDVELYVNDVLRGGQQTPIQGRYEFLSVPLVRGVNVIRVVAYGPRGERNEEVRVISVGGGQLAKGKTVVDVGVVEQDRNLIDLGNTGVVNLGPGPGRGRLRSVANIAYGLTSELTVAGGVGTYAPNGGAERQLATLGVRTSLLGWATQADLAHDSIGGNGVSIGLAGRPLGISAIVRHAEYRGGFVDETVPRGIDGRPLKRYTDITFDLAALPFSHRSVPIAARIERDEFANGDRDLTATVRASSALGRALVSAGVDYERIAPRGLAATDRLTGTLTASTYAAFSWQLRASLDYEISPSARLRATSLTADRNISANTAVRFGLGHSFEEDRSSTVQASTIFRLPVGDLSLNADYATPRHDWRIGLAFAFSLGFDPLGHRYAMRRSGAGSGGNLAVQAFVDANDNGRYDEGEKPVAGVAVNAGVSRAVTDAQGRAFVTGLGYAAVARAQANVDDVDLANIATPPAAIEFTPRAGVAAVVMYPIKAQAELLIRLLFHQSDGRLVGLSAVRLNAIRDGGATTQASTEYDGRAVFENLPAGRYHIDIDPAQAKRLSMRLTAPLTIVIPADGGVIPDQQAIVEFAH